MGLQVWVYCQLPLFMKSGLNFCKCGASVALFSDRKNYYRIECIGCQLTHEIRAKTSDEAKIIWNKSHQSQKSDNFDSQIKAKPVPVNA